MTTTHDGGEPRRWKRPQPEAIGPNRSFGGYYRTADRKLSGKDFRGVPLQTAEDAAIAAVRLGYQVVDAQISRGLDMARRLRGAADRAGVGETGDVLDLTEDLLTRSFRLGLEWLESFASQPGSPIKRLMTAEFRLLASLFGITADGLAAKPAKEADDIGRKPKPRTAEPRATSRRDPADSSETPAPTYVRPVRIRHGKSSTRRAVTVSRWELVPGLRTQRAPLDVQFYAVTDPAEVPLSATLTVRAKEDPLLELVTTAGQPSGLWRAGVCDDSGEQVGIVEIVL